MKRQGELGQKLLLLLLGGVALGLSGSPRRYSSILKQIRKEWRAIEYEALKGAIRNLYRSKLVAYHEAPDGSVTITLTDHGKQRALTYKLDELSVSKPERWDGKWRLVLFDIPERFKKTRDTLRGRLKQLGFFEFQRSVFVYPFECRNEIDFVIEFYQLRPWVRYVIADAIDNELHLRHKFGLPASMA